jgi:hypothetical protein
VISVNASSDFLEMRREGVVFRWWEPLVWEATSALVIVLMAPLIGLAVRRWRPTRENLFRPLLIHLGLTLPFAAFHVVGIWVLRETIYWLGKTHYGFFDDGVALVAFYEWRKDVLTYATLAAVYWVFDSLALRQGAKPQMQADQRIEVRDGATALFLNAEDITHVEAAGNYVEFHTEAKIHLVRGTLASWEQRLAAHGFLRVHRSRLVNRAKIVAFKATASGDLTIEMVNGAKLGGSRRFRGALQSPTP